jgi:hypothetical protein
MKNKKLLFIALIFFACKKSGSSNSSPSGNTNTYDAVIGYTASAQTIHWNDTATQFVIDSIKGLSSCALINFPFVNDTLFSG